MALKQVGVSAILRFSAGRAVGEMNRASSGFNKLGQSAQRSKSMVQSVGTIWNKLAKVGAGVAVGAGLSIRTFADFDAAAAALQSRFRNITEKDFAKFTDAALDLGRKTKFTAAEILSAMEGMSKFGVKQKEILGDIGTVAKLATIENVGMAKAAEMMLTSTSALGLPVSKANRVLNIMAHTAGNTAATIPRLVQGLKLAAPALGLMQVPAHQTIKVLGLLNDAALFGTSSGTALASAVMRIARNQKKGVVQLGKYSFQIEETAAGGVDLIHTLLNAAKAMLKIENKSERTAVSMKLFGMRGVRAAAAFTKLSKGLGNAKLDELFKKGAPKDFVDQLFRVRQQNVRDDYIKLTSAVNTLGVAMSRNFKTRMRGAIKGTTKLIGEVAMTMDFFLKDLNRLDVPDVASKLVGSKDIRLNVALFLKGLLIGFRDVGRAAKATWKSISGVLEALGLSTKNMNVQAWGTLAGKILAVGTVALGLGVVFKGLGFVLGGVFTVGLAKLVLVAGALWAVYKAARAVDEFIGASSYLAKMFQEGDVLRGKLAVGKKSQMDAARSTVESLIQLRKMGKETVSRAGTGARGPKVAITRELAEQRIRAKLARLQRQGIKGISTAQVLKKLEPQLSKLSFAQSSRGEAFQKKAELQNRLMAGPVSSARGAAIEKVRTDLKRKGTTGVGAEPAGRAELKKMVAELPAAIANAVRGTPSAVSVTSVVRVDQKEIGRANSKHQQGAKDRNIPIKPTGTRRNTSLGFSTAMPIMASK